MGKLFATFCLVVAHSTSSLADTNLITWGYTDVTNAPHFSTNAIAIVGGNSHALALLADRTLRSWGSSSVTNVPPGLTNIFAIAAGSIHSVALRDNGTVVVWGTLINGKSAQPPPEATNVVALGVGPGAQHGLALRADGTVVDWGLSSTTNIPPQAFNIVSVAAGSMHSLALRSDGRVIAWGDNLNGQIDVPGTATNVVAIATTWRGNLALRSDGRVVTWGTDPGISDVRTHSLASNVIEVAGSSGNGIALRLDGSVLGSFSAPASSNATNIMAIGGSGSAALALRAAGKPVFPLLPVRRAVVAGQNAFFRLGVVGARPMTYQWSHEGTNLSNATNLVLVLTNVQPSQVGPYVITVSNALGTATSAEMILNVEPLEVSIQPVQQTTSGGSNASFSSTIVGQGPFTYQWKFQGQILDGATNSTLSLTNVLLSQSGYYSLSVSNSFGEMTSQSVSLSVLPLIITNSPQTQTVLAGTNITLTVGVTGMPPFTYQWRFGNTDLVGATNSTLTLSNVEPTQSGTYSVVVGNSYGFATSADGTLTVLPLSFSSQPTNLIALLWSQPAISVVPSGQGPFVYQWRFNGTNLIDATNNPLVLPGVQLSQAGTYSVVVSNSYGFASSTQATLSLREVEVWVQPIRGKSNIQPA